MYLSLRQRVESTIDGVYCVPFFIYLFGGGGACTRLVPIIFTCFTLTTTMTYQVLFNITRYSTHDIAVINSY